MAITGAGFKNLVSFEPSLGFIACPEFLENVPATIG